MAQVREILFGAQLKDMESRFRRQEERFLREINEAREALRSRLDSLENFMKSEIAAIYNRQAEEKDERETSLKNEERERVEAIKAEARERENGIEGARRDFQDGLSKEIHAREEDSARLQGEIQNTNENLDRRANKLSQSLDNSERALRDLFQKETNSLNSKIDEKVNELTNLIQRTDAQIRNDMVFRTHFSSMMTGVVASLAKPWNLDPDSDDEGGEGQDDLQPVSEGGEGQEGGGENQEGDGENNPY
jgi:DNA repair exonuclease SbcCD ATPase subunit